MLAQYYYDGNGQRIKKVENGVTTINIDDMYEISLAEGSEEHHTKYFYGLQNELAAQQTVSGRPDTMPASALPFAMRFYSNRNISGLAMLVHCQLLAFTTDGRLSKTITLCVALLVILSILCMGWYAARSSHGSFMQRWATVMIVPAMLGVFGFSGCWGGFGEDAKKPWEDMSTGEVKLTACLLWG